MTKGSIWKHLITFSLPIMIGNLMQQLYNTVDGIVVGNYVGEKALASVGTSASLMLLFLSFAIGLSGGTGIMSAQFYGAQQTDELKKAVSTALILMLSVGSVLSVLGVVFSRTLVTGLLNVKDKEVLESAVVYFSICAGGFVFQFAYNAIASVLRATGDSKATLYFLMISATLNLVLDLIFVIYFRWGVAGAAAATIFSQFVSAAVSAVYMFRKYEMFRFRRGEFVFDAAKCRICLRLGVPTTLQQCIMSFGNVLVQRVVNSFGPETMAAFIVGTRVEGYVLIPMHSLNMGLSTFTGQNIGASETDRVREGWRVNTIIAAVTGTVLSAAVYLSAQKVAVLFGISGESMIQAVQFVRYMCIFLPMFSVYGSYQAVLQGSGDVLYASFCTLSSLIIRVASAMFLAYTTDFGYRSIWTGIPVGWAVCTAFAAVRYIRGSWIRKSIVKKNAYELPDTDA